jgi:uncharacterized phage-associated protein
MFSAKCIADYFLELAAKSDQPISSTKLQALVYYAHGWYAGYTGRALINEKVQAGPYGLVISSLYREFNRFGSSPIECKSVEGAARGVSKISPLGTLDTQTLLRGVFHSYASYDDIQLTEMVHATDSPWDTTWKETKGMRGVNIPFSRIVSHFKAALQNAESGHPLSD